MNLYQYTDRRFRIDLTLFKGYGCGSYCKRTQLVVSQNSSLSMHLQVYHVDFVSCISSNCLLSWQG
jgi:hypothetical protein